MAQGSGFQGTYKVTAKSLAEVVGGHWYYGFDCLACKKQFAVFDDISFGANPVKMVGEGVIRVVCPHCQADRLYKTDQVKHFRQP